MKDRADKYHACGTLICSPSSSNSPFSHKNGTYIHVFSYNIRHLYVSYHILFEGIYFDISYSTHIWNAYGAGNLLKIKIMYVCMYLLIGKGQSAQKRPYWGEDRIKRKIYE